MTCLDLGVSHVASDLITELVSMLYDDLQHSPFQSYLVFKVDDSHKIVD